MMSVEVGRKRVGRLLQVGVLAAAVASCGDSDSMGPPSDTTPPTVVSTDPAAGTVATSPTPTSRSDSTPKPSSTGSEPPTCSLRSSPETTPTSP